MAFTSTRRAALAAVAALLTAVAGCTVKDAQTPTLTGPSGLSLSLMVNAIPDTISQDGGSQSSVKVTAIGPNGKPISALPVRMDMAVNGVAADYGSLSARTIVTNADGVASVVYTAPPAPPGGNNGTCSGLPGTCVTIIATATSTDFANANPEQVNIRLVPLGVILPPASAPTASFTMSPTTALQNIPVTFDASASTIGTGASAITSYSWSFGDGTSGSGRTVNHTFTSQQTFNVVLTVTNDRGLSATSSVATTVSGLPLPSAKVVFSPAAPSVGTTIVFNGEQSTAAPGHSVTVYGWNFGDGGSASGSIATHGYSIAGTYNVVLSVADDTGQKNTATVSVSVTSAGGGGGGATAASFISSPSSPVVGQVVFFNASGSTAQTGHSLTKYAWDFGDGTLFTDTSSSTSHTFKTAGAFTVALVVTDDASQTATTKNSVTVAGAGANAPTAKFTSSPTDPVINQQVVFDASTSTASTGLTISDYAWVFGDGTPVVHTTSKTIAHSFNFANTFNVSLTVTDSIGGVSAISAQVKVVAGALPNANFTFSPAVGTAGSNITFTSTSTFTAPATSIVSNTWNFGDGSALNTSGAVVTHSFAAGTYSVTLTVTDDKGGTATVSKTVVVQ